MKVKKIIGLLLLVVLLTGVLCLNMLSAAATGEIVAEGTCGENLTWTLDDAGLLTISGTGPMDGYGYFTQQPWYSEDAWGHLYVTAVVIEEGVTHIGANAFSYFTTLQSITIPETVTSMGEYAFFSCTGLLEIRLPAGLTHIPTKAFSCCDSLTSIEIPEGVTSIGGYAFESCYSLTKITIPSTVTEIGAGAFSRCEGLTQIVIPDGVTKLAFGVFGSCTNLTSVTLHGRLTEIGEAAFRDCDGLAHITIPDSVTAIGNEAFAGCGNLQSVTIPDSVTQIGTWIFYDCARLEAVVLPQTLKSIPYFAFGNCTALQSIVIPDSVTKIGESAFNGCVALRNITISQQLSEIGYNAFKDCVGLQSIVLPATMYMIKDDAFGSCTNLWHVLFQGTEEQWNGIRIQKDNTYLTDAIRHYGCAGDEIIDLTTKNCRACCEEGNHNCEMVETAPTCTEDGSKVGTCVFCREVITEVIPALGHSEVIDAAIAATCTEEGMTEGKRCSTCNEVLAKQELIAATGHSFGQWGVTKEATRNAAGEEMRTCQCGATESREIPSKGGLPPVMIAVIAVAGVAVVISAVLIIRKRR